MLDCPARIEDVDFPVAWPTQIEEEDHYAHSQRRAQRQYSSWMTT
jgi:hypothetical protein